MASRGVASLDTITLTAVPEDISELNAFAPHYTSHSHTSVSEEKSSPSTYQTSLPESEVGIVRPTEAERLTLRRISGSIPWVAYTICAVEFAERASYYGCQFVFANFVQFPLPPGGNGAGATPNGTQETAGALGLGLNVSSAFVLLFQFLAYTIPIIGGWWADTRLGRFNVICIGIAVCGVAHLILVIGAIPSVLQAGHGLPPFVIGLLLLAFGAGLFKPNVSPILLDQDTQQGLIIRTLRSGERVIVDPEITAQRLVLALYALVNVGAFFGLATTYAEKLIGYWLAFSLPMFIYMLLPVLLLFINHRLVKKPPQGNQIGDFFRVIGLAFTRNFKNFGRKGFFDVAKPSNPAAHGITSINRKPIRWNDNFVEDTKRTIQACQVFLSFPIFFINDGGLGTIQNSQGSTLTTNGAPNDLLNNFNPLTIIIAIPIISYVIYPLLRRYHIHFGPIKRITFGFILAFSSNVIGAVLQWRIYSTSPCGYYATDCPIGSGVSPISIWWQIPQFVLQALSECFAVTSGLELAYARSPKHMKGFVTALFWFTNAISAAIQEACISSLKDPNLIWPWVGTAVSGAVFAAVFYWRYKGMDGEEYAREGVAEEEALMGGGLEMSEEPRGRSREVLEKDDV